MLRRFLALLLLSLLLFVLSNTIAHASESQYAPLPSETLAQVLPEASLH
ncbi:MAG: hypothetical protein ACLFUB_06325 [Cyclobacteriaceae bacterium]